MPTFTFQEGENQTITNDPDGLATVPLTSDGVNFTWSYEGDATNLIAVFPQAPDGATATSASVLGGVIGGANLGVTTTAGGSLTFTQLDDGTDPETFTLGLADQGEVFDGDIAVEGFATGSFDLAYTNTQGSQIDLGGIDGQSTANGGLEPFTETFAVSNAVGVSFTSTSPAAAISIDMLTADVVCFPAGTMIATADGDKPIETVRPGDRIFTVDGRCRPARWLGMFEKATASDLGHVGRDQPILVKAGAFGPGLPRRDVVTTWWHKVMIEGPLAQELFGEPAVLARFGALVNGVTIRRMPRRETLTVYNVLLDRHDVMFAEGLPVETYRPCDENHLMFSNHEECDILQRGPSVLKASYKKRFPVIYEDAALLELNRRVLALGAQAETETRAIA